jgi:hypothetical protein
VTENLEKWTVMVVSSNLMDEIMSCVNGSTAVLEDGTSTPRRTLRTIFKILGASPWPVDNWEGRSMTVEDASQQRTNHRSRTTALGLWS